MLRKINAMSLDALIDQTVPADIRLKQPLNLPEGLSEYAYLQHLRAIAAKNKLYKSYIGLGYYDTIVPSVIQRNVLENPGWYTAYTPYQPEISQGRLEALLNFQTMIVDLTGMEIANASLLDEATAAAEAMTMLHSLRSREDAAAGRNSFFMSHECFPQTIELLKTRAKPLGIELVIGDFQTVTLNDQLYGALLQYPAANGVIHDYADFVARAKQQGMSIAVAADILSLVLLTPPGEWGADIVLGSTQRFGVPMGYGGPHAAFFACRDTCKRSMPGRLIGVSVDADGNPALRMALQTREQHIRREKATSNICTAQALLAIMASMYAVYHGAAGLKRIATQVHLSAVALANELKKLGYSLAYEAFFDTLKLAHTDNVKLRALAEAAEINFRYSGEGLGIALDQTTSIADLNAILAVFAKATGKPAPVLAASDVTGQKSGLKRRESAILGHPVFNRYHSETEMMRYIKRLENKDLSLTHSMIALGSCTMKLNAAAELLALTWPEFANLHPFVPVSQAAGYQELIAGLDAALSEITGFAQMSFQPNSGASGEYAGLLVIQAYHRSRGEGQRNVALIPSSAHGTNPASAQMLSMKVVVVACDDKGNIDVADLRAKAEQHIESLAALMITYPSTHGVFEESVKEICQIIHDHGGQVYMDGANLNAQVGVSRPGDIGADVSHVNLHKTFCIPHGGGGPGMGPIGIKKHLIPFVANHSVVRLEGPLADSGAVSAAPWGSSSILPISWMYIAMMGASGLLKATQVAILSANYIARRLKGHFPVLYTGSNGRVAHECIIDLRPLKAATGITEEDVAKRLMDYGFHAPTMSFPVPGTLMIEPTESEPREELDRFIEAMICIRREIARVEAGELDAENNMLCHAPHTLADIMDDSWDRPYSKQEAAFPVASLEDNKFWPSVNRIDNVYGDRNLFCACPAIENYTG